MSQITIYGGLGEIGGNKIFLSSGTETLILDFGMSFGQENEYFEEFLRPRTNSILQDYLRLGLVPKIDGIYREDLLEPKAAKEEFDDQSHIEHLWPSDLKSYDEYLSKEGRPAVTALLLTHAHLDHSAYIGLLDEDIPIYTSQTTRDLMEVIDDIGLQGIAREAFTAKKRSPRRLGERSYTPGALKLDKEDKKRGIDALKDGEVTTIGRSRVKCYLVDHSVPGASAYLIETQDKEKIAYTGDLRFHGESSDYTSNFVEDIAERDIDLLICEGTRIDEEERDSEEEVLEETVKHINKKGSEGAVFVGFAWKDLTRYRTMLKAAKRTDRIFVISPKTAYTANCLSEEDNFDFPDPEDEPKVKVFLPRKDSMMYSRADYNRAKYQAGYLTDWSEKKDFTHCENGIKAPEIAQDPERFLVFLDFYNINQLLDMGKMPGSIYIRARSEPFNLEMELTEERLINWLRHFKINEENDNEPLQVHASGHASGPELIEMIEKVQPKKLVPVHTESPETFQEELKESDIEVEIPRYGEPIEI